MAPTACPYFPPQLASFFLAEHHVTIRKPPERHLALYRTQVIAGRLPSRIAPAPPTAAALCRTTNRSSTRTVESRRSSLCEPPTLVIDPARLFTRAVLYALRPCRIAREPEKPSEHQNSEHSLRVRPRRTRSKKEGQRSPLPLLVSRLVGQTLTLQSRVTVSSVLPVTASPNCFTAKTAMKKALTGMAR